MLDLNRMKEIVNQLYVSMVVREHGDTAASVLTELLDFIRVLYTRVAPETRIGRITVFKTLTDRLSPYISATGSELGTLDALPSVGARDIVLQTLSTGRTVLWSGITADPVSLAQDAVVYTYENGVEHFYARGGTARVLNPGVEYTSVFAIPTFTSLRAALQEYKTKQARKCSCKILQSAFSDSKRLFLKDAPESTMRDSLTQFLKICLRDAEVRPEQVVDDSHPVDIKITWFMSNRLALIEIKWLGASKSISGKLNRHFDKRANTGAKQLADYLDANVVQAPVHETRGFLVLIDVRRAGITATSTIVSKTQGMRYDKREITYKPDYHLRRTDFEAPIRMFVEPVCG